MKLLKNKRQTYIIEGVTLSIEYDALHQGTTELVDPSNFLNSQGIVWRHRKVLHKRKKKGIIFSFIANLRAAL